MIPDWSELQAYRDLSQAWGVPPSPPIPPHLALSLPLITPSTPFARARYLLAPDELVLPDEVQRAVRLGRLMVLRQSAFVESLSRPFFHPTQLLLAALQHKSLADLILVIPQHVLLLGTLRPLSLTQWLSGGILTFAPTGPPLLSPDEQASLDLTLTLLPHLKELPDLWGPFLLNRSQAASALLPHSSLSSSLLSQHYPPSPPFLPQLIALASLPPGTPSLAAHPTSWAALDPLLNDAAQSRSIFLPSTLLEAEEASGQLASFYARLEVLAPPPPSPHSTLGLAIALLFALVVPSALFFLTRCLNSPPHPRS